MTTTVRHPAKFSPAILDAVEVAVRLHGPGEGLILDPFAGVGRVHDLPSRSGLGRYETVGVELEPEWADQHPLTRVGNALYLDFDDDTFDVLVTSPCYGNRMADHHEARDDSRRNTYRHTLGRDLSSGSAAGLQWGKEYRQFHHLAWTEARRVLRPGALVVVNVSNHIRGGVEQRVVEWHLNDWCVAGATVVAVYHVPTPRLRHGQNHDLRVDGEKVLVLRTDPHPIPGRTLLR